MLKDQQTSRRANGRELFLFGLIFFGLVLRTFLSPPIWHHGEAREGLVVQAIVRDHQWILPFRNNELPSKPPLYHWTAASLALILGLSDFAVRLPSAIAACLMAVATFQIGHIIGGRKTAWLGVGALLGMYEFWDSGTEARVDMLFASCVTLAIAGFFLWQRRHQEAARVGYYIAAACAVLAKGPIGLLLPGLVIVAFLLVEGRFRSLWTFWSWPLAGVVFVINVGWYVLAYHIGGNEFLRLHIFHENIARFFGIGGFTPRNDFPTTAIWFATRTLPWNLVLLWSLARHFRGEGEDSAGRFLHVWWLSIVGFFAVAAHTRAVYLLPLYPAIALLAARGIEDMIARFTERSRSDSLRNPGSAIGNRRTLQIAKRVGMGVALCDLGLMLVNPAIWKDTERRNARLAFIEEISAKIPAKGSLFATPKLPETDLMVMAYRLNRDIPRKPMTTSDRSGHYLSLIASADLGATRKSVLAFSKFDQVALMTNNTGEPTEEN